MKYLLIITISSFVLCMGCNNAADNKVTDAKSQSDSLMDEVMKGHDAAMVKSNKIAAARKKIQQALDSIDKLSPALKKASMAFKNKLDSLSGELNYADTGMEKWMVEFNMDTLKNESSLREKYLVDEKEKVAKVDFIMKSAIQHADSILKK